MTNPKEALSNLNKTKTIANMDLRNRSEIEVLLAGQLDKRQLLALLNRIKKEERVEKEVQNLIYLNNLKKQLKSRYCINASKEIIKSCIETAEASEKNTKQLDFNNLDKQIKRTTQEIYRTKYQVKKIKLNGMAFPKKPLSADKRRNGNLNNSRNVNNLNKTNIKTFKNLMSLDENFIKQKSTILQDYLTENELQKFEQNLLNKIKNIENQHYGKYNERIKHYTIYDHILKKIFSLIQDDTKNVDIRTTYGKVYRKIKENMVSIITNEEDVQEGIKSWKKMKTEKDVVKNTSNKLANKKNYYQLDREKVDLNSQIEQALQTAKRHLKEAFIKRQRPDYAYELELEFQNRPHSRNEMKKIRF